MTKGTLTIEFDGIADLIQQLRLLTAGAALLDIETPAVVPRTTADTPKATERAQIDKPDPLYPTAETEERPEPTPDSGRGVLRKLGVGDSMTYQSPVETVTCSPQTVTQSPQATTVVAPQELAKDMASSAVPQQAPEHSEGIKADVTLDNLSEVPYETLLAFCEQNPGVGINVTKCGAAFFRPMVEHKVKSFLTTPAS